MPAWRSRERCEPNARAPFDGALYGVALSRGCVITKGAQLRTLCVLLHKLLMEALRQRDVFQGQSCLEQGSNLCILEAGYTAPNAGYKKVKLGMRLGEPDEIIHIRRDGFNTALHSGYCIALPLHPHTLSPHCAETIKRYTGCATAMTTCQITAEYKHLIGFQFGNVIGGKARGSRISRYRICFF